MLAEEGVVGIYLPSFNALPVLWWGNGTPERGVCVELFSLVLVCPALQRKD